MTKYLIGYKQGDNTYVYLANLGKNNITPTVHVEDAMDFYNIETAINICEYVNIKSTNTYVPIVVETEITEIVEKEEEVVEDDTITSE